MILQIEVFHVRFNYICLLFRDLELKLKLHFGPERAQHKSNFRAGHAFSLYSEAKKLPRAQLCQILPSAIVSALSGVYTYVVHYSGIVMVHG